MNLRVLFLETPSITREFEDELQALKSGVKAMSVFGYPCSSIEGSEREDEICMELSALETQAGASGLSVVRCRERLPDQSEYLRVFVCPYAQLWRVSAYIAIFKAFEEYRWCDAAERLTSSLLGYSDAAIRSWLASHHHGNSGWGVATIYLLMSNDEKQQLRKFGWRCLDPGSLVSSSVAFRVPGGLTLRADALTLCPGQAIGRVGVKHELLPSIFQDLGTLGHGEILSCVLSEEIAIEINQSIESRIEFWTSDGWS